MSVYRMKSRLCLISSSCNPMSRPGRDSYSVDSIRGPGRLQMLDIIILCGHIIIYTYVRFFWESL